MQKCKKFWNPLGNHFCLGNLLANDLWAKRVWHGILPTWTHNWPLSTDIQRQTLQADLLLFCNHIQVKQNTLLFCPKGSQWPQKSIENWQTDFNNLIRWNGKKVTGDSSPNCFRSMYMGQMSKPMTEYDWLNYSCKGEEAIFFCHSV